MTGKTLILKEKAIRLAKRILAKQIRIDENDEDETNESEENTAMDEEEDPFPSGFGFSPDTIESNEMDAKNDEIEGQGVCVLEQGEAECSQKEAIDTARTSSVETHKAFKEETLKKDKRTINKEDIKNAFVLVKRFFQRTFKTSK